MLWCRQDLAERQRLKEERAAAAAAALKAGKPVVSKVAGSGQAPRVADKVTVLLNGLRYSSIPAGCLLEFPKPTMANIKDVDGCMQRCRLQCIHGVFLRIYLLMGFVHLCSAGH